MSGTQVTWKLTGKGTGGQCEHCPRSLQVHYTVTGSNGQTMKVGRGCLKKVTGWTLTAAQADRELRIAERDAARAVRWAQWTAAHPAEAAAISAGAEREAAEIRAGRRQAAGPAQEIRAFVGDGVIGAVGDDPETCMVRRYLTAAGCR